MGTPYVAQVEEKTKRLTPAACCLLYTSLLLLEPLEGFDHGFLELRGASVFRDALHAVVQVAALGKNAGNAASVPVALSLIHISSAATAGS